MLETSRNTQQKHPGDLGKLANYFDDTNKVNGLDLGVSRLYCYMFVEGKLIVQVSEVLRRIVGVGCVVTDVSTPLAESSSESSSLESEDE